MIDTTTTTIGLYCIKDKHAGMYLPPFLASSDDEAKRIVGDSIEPNSILARFPADFHLIRCGAFNSRTGLSRDPEDMVDDVLCSVTDIVRQAVIDETHAQEVFADA